MTDNGVSAHQAQARILKAAGNMVPTAMRAGFEESLRTNNHNQRLGRIVVGVMARHKHSGLSEMGKGWNASLSYSTYLRIRGVCGLA